MTVMTDFKSYIAKVADGNSLSADEAEAAFDIVMSGNATPSQIGGFLMALRVRGETVDEITGAVRTMRSKMTRVKAPDDAIDIVGTGGDGTQPRQPVARPGDLVADENRPEHVSRVGSG